MSLTAMGIGLLETAGKPDGSGGFAAIPVGEVAEYTQAPLGFTHIQPASKQMSAASTTPSFMSGDREWIYVYNNSVSDLTEGTTCIRNLGPASVQAGFVGESPAAPLHANIIVGVAQHTIPAGFCGFILRNGAGKVDTDGALSPYGGIGISAVVAGEGAPVAPNTAAFAYALESTAGAGLAKAMLSCKG